MGPKPLIEACVALASHSTQGPATFAQAAAVEALSGLQKFVQSLAGEYRRRRDFLHPVLAAIPKITCVEPEGGFYLFPNVARYLRAEMPTTLELADRLLEERGVAVVPGEGFGAPGYVRISFARSLDELKEGSRRIVSFFAGLRGEKV
jgi:aspartate aminotransferase